jgi:signal transduction histidine kinase
VTVSLVLFTFAMFCFSANLYLLGLLWFADKHTRQIKTLIGLGLSIGFWIVFDSICLLAKPEAYGFLYMVRSVTLTLSTCFFFAFMCSMNGFTFAKNRIVRGLLWSLLYIDILLILTNPFHRKMFVKDGFPLPEYGPLFIYNSMVAYGAIFFGLIFLIRFIIVRRPPRAFLVSFLSVSFLGVVLNVLFTIKVIKLDLDVAPYALFFIFMILAIYVYQSRLQFFRNAALADIFESYPDAALLVDPRGVISDYNSAFTASFPRFEIEPQSTSAEAFYIYLEALAPLWNRAEGEFTVPGEPERTLSFARQEVRSGRKFRGYIVFLSDVSVYRSMIKREEELRLTAESASRAKSAFLATMSHEIRTPLNAIIGLSDIELQKKLEDNTRRAIVKIHNSGSDLLNIINDILDISKIEAGGFELIPVEYETALMINNTVQVNRVRIGSKPLGFELSVDENIPRKLMGDELRVKQILSNLLSNAIKYTKEGRVKLSVGWESGNGGGWLVCTVEDTGQGIKESDLPKLFAEYSQVDTRANRKVEGTGLGLSITRKLVEMMKGSIKVESEYGKGSVFTARFFQGSPGGESLGKDLAGELEGFRFRENSAGLSETMVREYMPYGKVLVVDDVEINLEVAQGIMEVYGLKVDVSLNGRDAIEKIRALGEGDRGIQKYDIVFMDHMMPEMDGIEAARIIREEINTVYAGTVPIIALTANALVGNEDMFLAEGFTGFLSKPIDLADLDRILNWYVKK